ncbi:MAG: TonB-dependent siderophore receptor [Acinetobacter sp.]|nr:TonB-dependent siderophore receptor [Acinetobacter sp.]
MSKHVIFKRFSHTALAIALCSCYSMAFAQESKKNSNEIEAQETNQTLETIEVQASNEKDYAARKADFVLKSDAPLFETAQSVSVITTAQLEQKQAATLAEALNGVAGVSAGQYGRRGWDDFMIRGQVSSNNIFVDGMRYSTNIFSGMEISGLESIDVLKGPSSVNFGQAAPGGMVNLTTKRPQDETFYRSTLTMGNFGLKQATFDVNYAPNGSSDGAFRINGRVSDQDDPTDEVYFKNYYISPSYKFNLGNDIDLSVMTSYHHREYLRQQGLPRFGTLENNPVATYDSSRFFGDPSRVVKYDIYRAGYNLDYQLNDQWKFKQNFAVNYSEMDGEPILAEGNTINALFADANGNRVTLTRQMQDQLKKDLNYTLDSSLNFKFNTSAIQNETTVGLDAMRERSDFARFAYYYNTINLNTLATTTPRQGHLTRITASDRHNLSRTQYMGLYARNHTKINNQWIIGLAGRHDWSQVQVLSKLNGSEVKNSDNAFTGNASIMYNWNDVVAPYVSYATSFLPLTDTDANGRLFDPETGKQFEVGVKLQSKDERFQGSLSYYDLKRKNIVITSGGVSEQYEGYNTKGYEMELGATLWDKLNLLATYSYIPTANLVGGLESGTRLDQLSGSRVNHVPKHAASLSALYHFDASKLGWFIGGSVRHEGDRSVMRTDNVTLPAYTLYDVQAGYEAPRWGANFLVKNVFDTEYFAGSTPNGLLLSYGEPLNFRVNVKFKF